MITTSPRRSAPTLESLRPPPRLRPAQAAPVRRGQPAGGEARESRVGALMGWGMDAPPLDAIIRIKRLGANPCAGGVMRYEGLRSR